MIFLTDAIVIDYKHLDIWRRRKIRSSATYAYSSLVMLWLFYNIKIVIFTFHVDIILLTFSSVIDVVCRVFYCVYICFLSSGFVPFLFSLFLSLFFTDDLPLNAMNKLLKESSATLNIFVRHFPSAHIHIHLQILSSHVTFNRHFIITSLEGEQNDFVSSINPNKQ